MRLSIGNRVGAVVLLFGLALFASACGFGGADRASTASGAAEQRTVVYDVYGIQFVNPFDTRKVLTGETLKAAADASNLYLEDGDETIKPVIPRERIRSMNRVVAALSSEQTAQVSWYANPRPVNGGRQIVFNSNKTSLMNGSAADNADIHIISIDGSGERLLLDGESYGNLRIVDTIGTRVYAEGGRNSLVVMDVVTLEVKRFMIGGRPDAVSADGNYVLFRKVEGDYVLPELYVFNLVNAETLAVGPAPEGYFFGK